MEMEWGFPCEEPDKKTDFSQKADVSRLHIAFVIPKPIKGGGGHRNIFRAVKYLYDFGHEVTVFYTQSQMEAEEIKRNVSEWFYDMSGITFACYQKGFEYYDVGIATWWETAYLLKREEHKFRELFYFVQDYEPYFYPISSNYILAENTYRMGLAHICSGAWCKKILEERFHVEAVSFQFPLDTSIYHANYKRNKQRKNIVFFAKPELPRRCYELGLKALRLFHEKAPEIEIILFGSQQLAAANIPFKTTILNLVPELKDLARLYCNADLGIVFSTTNPSLVPYEMMSCGCPVVDLKLEYALEKYGGDEGNVFLLDPQPELFADALYKIIYDEKKLLEKSRKAMVWVQEAFPSEIEMAKTVERSIINKLEKGSMV